MAKHTVILQKSYSLQTSDKNAKLLFEKLQDRHKCYYLSDDDQVRIQGLHDDYMDIKRMFNILKEDTPQYSSTEAKNKLNKINFELIRFEKLDVDRNHEAIKYEMECLNDLLIVSDVLIPLVGEIPFMNTPDTDLATEFVKQYDMLNNDMTRLDLIYQELDSINTQLVGKLINFFNGYLQGNRKRFTSLFPRTPTTKG